MDPSSTIALSLLAGALAVVGWFLLLHNRWYRSWVEYLVILFDAFAILLFPYITVILAEAYVVKAASTTVNDLAVGPILEESMKLGLTIGACRISSHFFDKDPRKFGVIIGMMTAASEGLGLIWNSAGGLPLWVALPYSVARIAPMHAVTTLLAVDWITGRSAFKKVVALPSAIFVHSFYNLVVGLTYLVGYFLLWPVFAITLVLAIYRVSPTQSARAL